MSSSGRGRHAGETGEGALDIGSPEFHFWLRHARRSQEPIVVAGAGSGRVALPLAAQELRVIAIEPDAAARGGGAGLPLEWQAGELGAFTLARRAGMMAFPHGAFQWLLTLEAQRATLRHAYEGLQVGGKLVVGLAVPDVLAMAASRQGTGGALRELAPRVEPESGRTVYGWAAHRYDLARQHVTTHEVSEVVDEAGVTVRRWHRTSELAYLWPREMQLLLEGAGFELEACYGGWDDAPLTADSVEQIWVARKGA